MTVKEFIQSLQKADKQCEDDIFEYDLVIEINPHVKQEITEIITDVYRKQIILK
jgi:hypothetical protein